MNGPMQTTVEPLENNKVKLTLVFKGREVVYADRGRAVMNRVIEEIKTTGKVEAPPKMEGKAMIMILTPG